MQFRIAILASLATASSLLGFVQPASAQYSKVCATNTGAYVAQYKLTLGTDKSSRDTGYSSGTGAGAQKCYTAADAWGSTAVPANSVFTLNAKAKGGTDTNCKPSAQSYSATGGTINYKSSGTTTNVTCQ
jgi:hypothetical protein